MATLLQRTSLGVGAALLLLAVVVSAAVVARSIETLGESFDRTETPAEFSRTLLRLRIAVGDAETAQRGFLLTGERPYLAPYAGVRPATDSLLAVLDSLARDTPTQRAQLLGLRAAVVDKMNEMDEVLALERAGRRDAAVARVRTERGARLMTDIRARSTAMLAEARRTRLFWTASVGVAQNRALVATAVTNAVLLVLIVAAGLLLLQQQRTRDRAAARLALSNTQLSQAVVEREAALVHVHAMQGQLVQQEKLAGLGRLTAGVAHELKNPLNFVNNFAALADELADEAQAAFEAGRPDEARALLPDLRLNVTKIGEHGRRADEIVRTMLVHARGVSGEREPVDLGRVLATAATQAAGPADADLRPVRISVDASALGEATVAGIPSALGRLFLNLVENAVQATRERAGYEAAGYEPAVYVEATLGRDRMGHDVAVVTVADNGAGISDVSLPRIFEPFYTTKAPGQGTGLGLSLAYDIAVGHGGTLAAGRSDRGGALLTVSLPLTAALAPAVIAPAT